MIELDPIGVVLVLGFAFGFATGYLYAKRSGK